MQALIQRARNAEVEVDGEPIARIDHGLLVYVGVQCGDGPDDVRSIVDKVRYLRVFPDDNGKMNLDVIQTGGSVLLVSSFTLVASTRRGRRPEFTNAASPDSAARLVEDIEKKLSGLGVPVAMGRFGAMMQVSSSNDGPINLVISSRK